MSDFLPSDFDPEREFLSDIPLETDTEGRICLNTIHIASGGGPKDAPSRWARLQKTKEYIQALIVSRPIRYGSTFAVRPLADDYAGWISAEFRLCAIEIFGAAGPQNHLVRMFAALKDCGGGNHD